MQSYYVITEVDMANFIRDFSLFGAMVFVCGILFMCSVIVVLYWIFCDSSGNFTLDSKAVASPEKRLFGWHPFRSRFARWLVGVHDRNDVV